MQVTGAPRRTVKAPLELVTARQRPQALSQAPGARKLSLHLPQAACLVQSKDTPCAHAGGERARVLRQRCHARDSATTAPHRREDVATLRSRTPRRQPRGYERKQQCRREAHGVGVWRREGRCGFVLQIPKEAHLAEAALVITLTAACSADMSRRMHTTARQGIDRVRGTNAATRCGLAHNRSRHVAAHVFAHHKTSPSNVRIHSAMQAARPSGA